MDGIGLSEAIESIRADLLEAQASGDIAGLRFPVQSVTVELKVVAAKAADGKAGFKVPVIDLELGAAGSLSSERTSTITVVFGAPVDVSGHKVKVAHATDVPKR